MAIVANCAGPFAATSAPMIETCLMSRIHYLDITGEIDVFVAAQRRHAEAQAAGIVIAAPKNYARPSRILVGRGDDETLTVAVGLFAADHGDRGNLD